MNFINFKSRLIQFVVFSLKDIEKKIPGFNKMNLLNWQKKGYITKLRNGWYKFNETPVEDDLLYYIANRIYAPSYLSLETALHFHGVIPEGVFTCNSITTLKTCRFKTSMGLFNYTNIKSGCFFGYQFIRNKQFIYKIADIEKALLDYLYINHRIGTTEDFDGLRLNKYVLKEKIDTSKLSGYAKLFNSKTLTKKAEMIKFYIS
jgi:predicted transcriptional regulator of viral defense system